MDQRQSSNSKRLWQQSRPLDLVILSLIAISILVQALTISQLIQVRSNLRNQIDRLAQSIEQSRDQSLSFTMPIRQEIPVEMDVPIQRSFDIPVQTTVRIQDTINIPIETGILGSYTIPVPIDLNVPINTTVPFELNETIAISTSVPLQLDLPISIELNEDPFSGYLDQIYQNLLLIREQF
jgi:hypothetical protein